MIKHLITAMLFVLGGAGVALVGYLATEPLAFTRFVREMPSVAADRSPAVSPASVPIRVAAVPNSLLLADVRITATPRRAAKQPVVPARFDPCSEWREVGALSVEPTGTGAHNVRSLCAQPDVDR